MQTTSLRTAAAILSLASAVSAQVDGTEIALTTPTQPREGRGENNDRAQWATESARTLPSGRLEVGALSATRWGVTRRVEVAAHPLGLFLWPSVRAKIRWWGPDHGEVEPTYLGPFWLATQHQVSVPSPFLHLIAREGSGGLLPANTDVPFAVQLDTAVLGSAAVLGHLVTLKIGVAVAAHEKTELALVEFPFLYSALAPLYSPAVFHFGFASEGGIWGPIDYQFLYRTNVFHPDADIPWPGNDTPWVAANDAALRLRFRLGKRHRVSVGAAASLANYPIGHRFYWTPTFDYRYALVR